MLDQDLAIRYALDRVTPLDTVRGFADPEYADLSLRMRTGKDPGSVFDELLRRGEIVIHASDVERQDKLAARAANSDLVVADTREQVPHLNTIAHRLRKLKGEVDDSVTTAAGESIGVGDSIATRRNDHDADVANPETRTVVGCVDGSLTVRSPAGLRMLPSDYVRASTSTWRMPPPPTARRARQCRSPTSWSASTPEPRRRTSACS